MNRGALVGLLVMVVSEGATLARIEPFYSWNTPIAWTGFILFADSIVWRARRRSWMLSNPAEFAFLAVVSIPLWLVFEFYNLYIDNWYYTGLPANFWWRQFGYAWSFGTIWPAIFEAADLIDVWRGSPRGLRLGNIRLGADSLFEESRTSGYPQVKNLILSGFLCGGLWEFWNYWAGAKWHYSVPIMEHLKIFEMPVPGYFGFPAFTLECFTMYVLVRAIATRLVPSIAPAFSYPIALPGVTPKRQARR